MLMLLGKSSGLCFLWAYQKDQDISLIRSILSLTQENRWFERGVPEAIWLWERVEKPSLNKDGGFRFQLPHAWAQSLINIPCQLTLDRQQLQSIPPIHLCSCLKKSNEIGWKFASHVSKQTLSRIWFIISNSIFQQDDKTTMQRILRAYPWFLPL